jgi:hypothetical protein
MDRFQLQQKQGRFLIRTFLQPPDDNKHCPLRLGPSLVGRPARSQVPRGVDPISLIVKPREY